ncbi:hypothetical protein GJR96_09025 [Haloferax sp. MBLA0076]|uniref:Putative sensor domain-containing protein n=1 Tax=Haloferax litoreum TaxID=2666140 RepID=A0A6A8GIY6_9EURY|nr:MULTISPECIES: sensor domain-containing protein [Haloferax]KAB1193581.1 hypothetical protein Hfx1148_09010 [Haloferax sp. CBA1148]MRX22097.1 hypothetical protein [Haloferax litoreum]
MNQTESSSPDVLDVLTRAVSAPLQRQTYKNFLYLAVAFPLGLLYFVTLVTMGALGVGGIVLLFGIPLLLITLFLGTAFMRIETESVRRLVGFEVTHRTGDTTLEDGILAYVKDLVTDYGTYVSLVVVFTKFWVGLGLLVSLTVWSSLTTAFVLLPFYYDYPGVGVDFGGSLVVLPELRITQDLWTISVAGPIHLVNGEATTLQGALVVSALGLALLFVGLNLVNVTAWLLGYVTKHLAPHARVVRLG